MSNISGDDGGSFSSQQQQNQFNGSNLVPSSSTTSNSNGSTSQQEQPPTAKKRRNLPGNPDPNAEVIALSPKTLMATNRFVCEICSKGFQRDQNLQLHRRGHNLPWKLKQRSTTDIRKRVYVCPETSCVHHNPARALGDLTGIKKHFCRKHGEKKWKCEKCSKKYAVQSDWKAHSKTCGTKEYKCDCGTIFSRRDSFITHRAFCDALAEENNKPNPSHVEDSIRANVPAELSSLPEFTQVDTKNTIFTSRPLDLTSITPKPPNMAGSMFSSSSDTLFGGPRLQLNANSSLITSAQFSATALLQKAAQMGATVSGNNINSHMIQNNFVTSMAPSSFTGMMSPETSSSEFFGTGPGMNNFVGMYSGMCNQNHGFLENMERGENGNSENILHGSENMMTVDFMGVEGKRVASNFHGQGNQGLGVVCGSMSSSTGQQRMQGLSTATFQQQISSSTGQVVVTSEKSMWNV